MSDVPQEAEQAATEFIDHCIAISVEHGGRPPSDLTRAEAIVGAAMVTARWMKLSEHSHA